MELYNLRDYERAKLLMALPHVNGDMRPSLLDKMRSLASPGELTPLPAFSGTPSSQDCRRISALAVCLSSALRCRQILPSAQMPSFGPGHGMLRRCRSAVFQERVSSMLSRTSFTLSRPGLVVRLSRRSSATTTPLLAAAH